MAEEDEIKIGDKSFGKNSKVTLTIGTLYKILAGAFFVLFSAAMYGYFDVQSKLNDQDKKMDSIVNEKVDKKLNSLETDIKQLIREQGDIKGDVKVILDRTKEIEVNHPTTHRNFQDAVPE